MERRERARADARHRRDRRPSQGDRTLAAPRRGTDARAQGHPRHRDRRRPRPRARRPRRVGKPQRPGAVRLRGGRAQQHELRRSFRPGKPGRRARLSRKPRARRGARPDQRRPRADRPRPPGRRYSAVHDDGTHCRRVRARLRGAARRHALEEGGRRAPRRQAIGGENVGGEIRFPRQDQPRDPHVVSLLNDLLDLSKIEAGKLDLTFASLNLNEVVQSCVALMQPQANRERIIIRTSLAPGVRPVVADARSVRQIVLNLLSNSIKFTGAGGQVIVSTAQSGTGEIVLRVRDTGIGMDEKELAVALEPFRQLATSTRWGSAGTGLGPPLTKALAEANRANFAITSKLNDGTLVEIAFPGTRVLVE